MVQIFKVLFSRKGLRNRKCINGKAATLPPESPVLGAISPCHSTSLNGLIWPLCVLYLASTLISFLLFIFQPGKQVNFLFSHILSENIQSGNKIISGKDCGDRVMAEAPCLRYSLAHWTTLFLSSDRRVGTGQRWRKPEQQALAETSTFLLPWGQLCHLLNHWNSEVFHSSVVQEYRGRGLGTPFGRGFVQAVPSTSAPALAGPPL